MENSCMAERALKPSLRGEFYTNKALSQQVPREDLFSLDPAEYLSVDCFLDLPSGQEAGDDRYVLKGTHVEEDDEYEKDSSSVSSLEDSNSNILHAELCVPDDDIADLEWVSHFVDDYECEFPSFLSPLQAVRPDRHANRYPPQAEPVASKGAASVLFPCQVPAKARTKRARPAGVTKTWATGYPFAESPLSSSTSPSFSASCIRPDVSVLGSFEPETKKPKKSPTSRAIWDDGPTQFQRRCSHCQVQKTPQWRTGPLGPKTLCNACGVRYKSGRLFPEYRPACSPTFSSEIHSNSHRKVLEMRKRKEVDEPVSRFNQMVQSF